MVLGTAKNMQKCAPISFGGICGPLRTVSAPANWSDFTCVYVYMCVCACAQVPEKGNRKKHTHTLNPLANKEALRYVDAQGCAAQAFLGLDYFTLE